MKIKSNIAQKSIYFLSFFALFIGSSTLSATLSPASVSAAAAKCYFYGELTDSEKGTISLSCDTIKEEYKKLAGGSFKGFKANTCYMLSDLPRPSAKKTDCAKAEKAVKETKNAGSTIDEPSPGTGSGDTSERGTCPNRVLTFPTWYRGLQDTATCDIKSPGGGETALSDFIWTIVLNVIEIALQLVGYLAVGFIIYGGFVYITGAGSPDKITAGRKIILNAVVGLIISIFSIAIVNLVIGGFGS